MVILRTGRLNLETWEHSDWTAFRHLATDLEVMRYITGGVPWTDEQIQAWADRQVNTYAERRFCRWKLTLPSTGEMIGFCGVGFWRDLLEPEIGWWVARRHWGQGLATEAARAALRDGFERVGLDRIYSVAMRDNRASTRIMEKLGMRFECSLQGEHHEDLVRYVIDRADYLAAAQQRDAPPSSKAVDDGAE